MKKDEKNGSMGRTICTRSLSTSTSAPVEQETLGLRRSNREIPSKKPTTPASSTRKSERLAPSPVSVTKKSGRMEKKNTASTLSRSDKESSVPSQNSKGSDKSGRNADTSSDIEQRKDTKLIKKREPKMTGRAYRALFRGQLKISEALETVPKEASTEPKASTEEAASPLGHLIHQKSQMKEVNPSSNDEELVVVGCSRRVPAGNDDARDSNTDCPPDTNLELKRLPVGETSLEKGTDFSPKLVRDAEKMVLDAPPVVETGDDSVTGSPSENPETKLLLSQTTLENDIDLPLKRKRDTAGIVVDVLAIVANGDDHVMSSDGAVPSPSGCKIKKQSEMCSTCKKRRKVNGEFEDLRVCSCIALPVQESDHVAQDMTESEPTMSRDCGENRQNMQQDKSYDPKLYSSIYPEYWVPVQLSDVQLEQYCRTLLSKSVYLSSQSKKDLGALEETLTSVRNICDHPYVADASLKQLFNKNLEPEYLDVEIKTSGKLHLLDAMLTQIKENGLKAVVVYQTTQSPEGLLLGNMLMDIVSQRFGPESYEHGIFTSFASRKNAVNNFNKEGPCFVLLLEKRACSQSIKLLRADAFILLGSNLNNPSHDVKLLEKIKIESSSERTKIFRLYSTFTVEEKALILATQNKPVENLNRPFMHALLMWGASYLFDKLNHFHGGEITDSGVPSEQAIVDGVVHEFSSILSSKGGKKNDGKLCLLLEAKHAQGTYSTDSTLFGEEHVKLSDESNPNTFWAKLLGGKNPKWKYSSGTPQRNRKRVQYFQGSEDSAKSGNGRNTKKRKKATDDFTNPPADKNERNAAGKDHMGALESPIVQALQSSCKSDSGTNGTLNGNDAFGLYCTDGPISGIPEDMLAGNEWRQMPRESQRSLHAVLKLEMAKLGKILHLSEDWTSMVEKFLEYVIENYRVCKEPATILQAFQIALIWIAALLVNEKPKKKESLVLAKSQLAFSCSRKEVDYVYSFLFCMKSLFLERTQGATVCQEENNTKSMRSSGDEECMTDKRGSHYSSATEDIKKTISDIKKRFKKQEQELVQKHKEEKAELVDKNANKMKELEKKKIIEAALIRVTCSRTSAQTAVLKQMDLDYENNFHELTSEMEKCLKELEQMHEAAKKKLAEDEACWISRIENWAQAELTNCVPTENGNNNNFSRICSSNTPKNAPDVQTCNDANSEGTRTDVNCMVSKGNQVPEAENTIGTMLGGSSQQVHEIVTSRSDKATDVPTSPREQPTDNVASKSQSSEQTSVTVHELVTSRNDKATDVPTLPREPPADNVPTKSHSSEHTSVAVHEMVTSRNDKATDVPTLPHEPPSDNVPTKSQSNEQASVTAPDDSQEEFADCQEEFADRITSAAPDEEASSKVPEISKSFGNLAKSASSAFTLDRVGALVTKENIVTSHVCSDAVNILDQQNEKACPLDKEIPDELALPVAEPASVVETTRSAESDQDGQDICPMPSSPAGKQPDTTANIQGQNIEAAIETQPAGSETVEAGGFAASEQGDQGTCPLPSSPAANIEGQNLKTSAEPHIAGPDAVEIGDFAVLDQETMGAQDACSLPPPVAGTDESGLAANIEGQIITTVAQLHTDASGAVESVGYPVLDEGAQDASPLPDAAVSIEGLNNTTVAEPHTSGPKDACEMEIAETGPQVVEQPAFAANNLVELVNEGGGVEVEPTTPPVPLLVNNAPVQQPIPQIPFPVFNDPFQYELEKLRRESENTRKTFEEKKLTLKAELERKMAEVEAEYQRKFHEVETEHKCRVLEIETNKNLVSMNKLLANAFMSKCTDKSASHPPAATRGRIQQLAHVAALSLRNHISLAQTAPAPAQTAPAPAPSPVPAPAPVQPQAISHPRPMPQPRQPLISNTAPVQTAPALASTPASVQPQATSYPRPIPQPRQTHISNTAPSPSPTPAPSATPASNPVANARRVPPPHLRSSIRLTSPTPSSLPPQPITYSPVLVQQQQEPQNLSNGLDDVVCLSDDE